MWTRPKVIAPFHSTRGARFFPDESSSRSLRRRVLRFLAIWRWEPNRGPRGKPGSSGDRENEGTHEEACHDSGDRCLEKNAPEVRERDRPDSPARVNAVHQLAAGDRVSPYSPGARAPARQRRFITW